MLGSLGALIDFIINLRLNVSITCMKPKKIESVYSYNIVLELFTL